MVEKIKWWMLCISIIIGMCGLFILFKVGSLNEEIISLNKQVEQQNMLIDYLEQEVKNESTND